MTDARALLALAGDLEQSLNLLDAYRPNEADMLPIEQLPSLLEQCQALISDPPAPDPLRSVHHFACSGGTLMTKGLAAMPNVVCFSEMDPLSKLIVGPKDIPPRFAPTDLLFWMRHAARPVQDDVLTDVFCAGLLKAHERLGQSGCHLLLRDHAHSQFCTPDDPDARPSLHQILSAVLPVLSLVTVRHPLDSFMSLQLNNWVHFAPGTLDEYSRRYLKFLDVHAGLPVVKYEDFTEDPDAVLKHMGEILALPYNPMALDLLHIVRMSGDSGRKGTKIAPRPRRKVPAELEKARTRSPAYETLCARMSYEP